MKHAYLIIAHNEFTVLKTLLKMLDDERNTIFIHIDGKATTLYEQAKNLKTQKANLYLLAERINVYWGHISQVEVEYLLLETAVKQANFAYYHLLSGVDLPIQSQDTIHNFFAQHSGKEFVSFWNTPSHLKDLDRKISRYYFFAQYRRRGEKWHTLTTPLFNIAIALQKITGIKRKKEFEFQKGPNWFSITHSFAQYIISKKKWVLKRFNHTLCPDEIFLQTLLWNSPFKDNIFDFNNDNLGNRRLIDWKRGHPYIWQNEDFEELKQSEMLFARKFSSSQTLLLNMLKSELFNNLLERDKLLVVP